MIANTFLGFFYFQRQQGSLLTPLSTSRLTQRPLDEFSFDRLIHRLPQPSSIELDGVITRQDSFTSYLFSFSSSDRQITGQLNLPTQASDQPLPVIIMLRGFVEVEQYFTGAGTKPAADFFAQNGFITIAPDFLGFGHSDPPPEDIFHRRLIKPVTVIDLIASTRQLQFVNPDQVFIWGHSNGGQIALSVLEITSTPIPTALWAPVTKPFPYNILYYTDQADDGGKSLRQQLANFEKLYDTDRYSITNYLNRLNAPLQIHQGGRDRLVPQSWSDEFVARLEKQSQATSSASLEVIYHTYPAADHNLRPDWDTVVQRDLDFFRSHLNSPQ